MTKRRLTTALTRYVVNPVVKPLVRARLLRGWAILETRGRKSGLARRTPVGDGLIGDTFWIVAEHGRKAGYVRNIEADPRVRVFVDGTWRTGTAQPLPGDDPIARQRQLRRQLGGADRGRAGDDGHAGRAGMSFRRHRKRRRSGAAGAFWSLNARFVRLMGTDLLTIRIDLEPLPK